jgi:hypothetical protein
MKNGFLTAGVVVALLAPASSAAAVRLPAFAPLGATVNEGRSAVVTVRLSSKATQRTTVRYRTRGSTATAGADFVAKSGRLVLRRGQTSKQIRIRTIPDGTAEPSERFAVVLSHPSHARVRAASARVVIVDDDLSPVIQGLVGEPGPAAAQPNPAPTSTPNPDTTPPAAPTIDYRPVSPSNDPTPEIFGGAEAGSTVRIYLGATPCTGRYVDATAAQLAAGVEVAVDANAITTIAARAFDAAGNGSPCSVELEYVHDDTAPSVPVLTVSGSGTTVMLGGTAEPGSRVQIYADSLGSSACSGAHFVETISQARFASNTYAYTVGPGTTTTFSVASFDEAGNFSGCSATQGYTAP